MTLPVEALLTFWFGSTRLDAVVPPAVADRWFRPDPAFDAELRERFGALLDAPDEVGPQAVDPASALAAVLVLDQLPRNSFRGTARAFATDARALAVTDRAMAAGWDTPLGMQQRLFLYLPFQHAEDRARQERAVDLYTALAAAAPPELAALAATLPPFARKHRDIVARFGRFPGRNPALGRPDSAEESAWLAEGGDTFGQR